jgi:hypothetical protein
MRTPAQKALDGRARRAATRAGYVAHKSRCRRDSIDNGGYRLVSPTTNFVVMGTCYNLTADDVLRFCSDSRGD